MKNLIKTIKPVCVLVCILCCIVFSSCSSGENKYDKAARKAAETIVANEISDYTWTTVETGKLEYQYTVYNEKRDEYKVSYFVEFDAADEPEDEYLDVEITLKGDKFVIVDSGVSYMDAETYLWYIDAPVEKITDKDGEWIRVA